MDEKSAMISLVYQDWKESDGTGIEAEFFQALVELVKTDKITAFYDDTDGCIKYESAQ